MIKKTVLTNLLLFSSIAFSWAQFNSDYLLWEPERKLSVNDFKIKTKQFETTTSFAQFTVDYQVKSFDFLKKNFNKRVHNYFIKSASWIDTTTNVSESLIYQQTLFNICEVYTRQFRKALKENKKKVSKNTALVNEINSYIISEFSKRRIDYDRETKFGIDKIEQEKWELQIQKELTQLADYAYDK